VFETFLDSHFFKNSDTFRVQPEIPLFERSEFRNFLIFLFLFVSRQKEKEVNNGLNLV